MAVASFNMEDGFSILSRSEGVGPVNGCCRRALNITGRERISNLGWSFFLQIFRQDNPYLSPWWTNLSEILYTSDLIIVLKSINIFANLVHQGLRYGVFDGTFVG